MRLIGVSLSYLALLTVLGPTNAAHTEPRPRRTRSKGKEPRDFSFETAPMPEKVVFLSANGEHQAAVEHFLASYTRSLQSNTWDAFVSYERSIKEFAGFVAAPGAKWGDFSEGDKVRAFWQDGNYASAIAVYDASEACKADSKATAAYLDCKLKRDHGYFDIRIGLMHPWT